MAYLCGTDMKEIEHQFVNHQIIIKTITYRRNEMLFSLFNPVRRYTCGLINVLGFFKPHYITTMEQTLPTQADRRQDRKGNFELKPVLYRQYKNLGELCHRHIILVENKLLFGAERAVGTQH